MGQATEVMLGQSFLNRFTPASGRHGPARSLPPAARGRHRHRRSQHRDHERRQRGSAGRPPRRLRPLGRVGRDLSFELPGANLIALVLAAVLVAAGVILLTPWGRRVVLGWLRTTLAKVTAELGQLARDPAKMMRLFGGAVLAKLAIIVAFTQSCRASASTPRSRISPFVHDGQHRGVSGPHSRWGGRHRGGAGRRPDGIGVDNATALSVTLVFRLATYWLPVLPAWLALRHLRHTEVV